MRIVRFLSRGDASAGADETDRLARWGFEHADGSVTRADGDLFPSPAKGGPSGFADTGLADTGEEVEVGRLLAPLRPAAILCIGLNYAEHAAEQGKPAPERPVLFMKTATATQHPGGPIVLPRRLRSTRVDYEAELAVVIGRTAKNVGAERALDYVLGYTCANDVSARDWQRDGGGGQWCRGKTFDTFAPIGPALVTADELGDASGLRISTTVTPLGGVAQVLQDSTTADMIFGVAALVEFLSASTTLVAGTLILTGTPSGVGFARNPARWLAPGDQVTVEIERIGALTNQVVEEEAEPLERWALGNAEG
jgi:2-keto-4-pentenoate hydratase/2-oxohepta-3-ene-1,7-dioic acid hydratase in catechol pathway